LFTTIREFVENGLDAAETARVLPQLEVTIEEVSRESYNKTAGMGKSTRVNQALYHASAAAAPAPSSAGSAPAAAAAADAAPDAKTKGPVRKQVMYYRVTVRDNGMGMPHDDVPNMFGRGASAPSRCVPVLIAAAPTPQCWPVPSTVCGRRAASSAWAQKWCGAARQQKPG
jgi:hypothetical protein